MSAIASKIEKNKGTFITPNSPLLVNECAFICLIWNILEARAAILTMFFVVFEELKPGEFACFFDLFGHF